MEKEIQNKVVPVPEFVGAVKKSADKKTEKKEKNSKEKKEKKKDSVFRVTALGGLDEIGMNMTVVEYENSAIIIDCGSMFVDEFMPGIELIIPNISYVKKIRKNGIKIEGLFITHGHDDHIGAIPHLIGEIDAPVFTLPLTAAFIKRKLNDFNITPEIHEVTYGSVVSAGTMRVEFVRINHSIPDAAALAISAGCGTIVHTGDFKIDYSPINGKPADLWRLGEIGKKGVLAVMNDSTNAQKPGYTMSESSVTPSLERIFNVHKDSRIFVTLFSSNIDRIQQIINTAQKFGRKVVIDGRSIAGAVEIAEQLGYLHIPGGLLIIPDEDTDVSGTDFVYIITGSQGETYASLSRIANGQHEDIRMEKGDVVLFSARAIPGNEKAINRVMNKLEECGAEIIRDGVHVSGHACQEEIKLLYTLLRPKYIIPLHGEFCHRKASVSLARDIGYTDDNTLLVSAGDVIEIGPERCAVADNFRAGKTYVDASGIIFSDPLILENKMAVAKKGVIMVSVYVDTQKNCLPSFPKVFEAGWVYNGDKYSKINEIEKTLYKNINLLSKRVLYSKSELECVIRKTVRDCIRDMKNSYPEIKVFIAGL